VPDREQGPGFGQWKCVQREAARGSARQGSLAGAQMLGASWRCSMLLDAARCRAPPCPDIYLSTSALNLLLITSHLMQNSSLLFHCPAKCVIVLPLASLSRHQPPRDVSVPLMFAACQEQLQSLRGSECRQEVQCQCSGGRRQSRTETA
jgi:hypothetical protein